MANEKHELGTTCLGIEFNEVCYIESLNVRFIHYVIGLHVICINTNQILKLKALYRGFILWDTLYANKEVLRHL